MKRPWKVRWYSYNWMEYFIKSYAYEQRARDLVQRLIEYGIHPDDIQIWEAA